MSIVHRPDLVRPLDRHAAQQVRIHRMSRMLPARIGTPVQGLDAHALHERTDMLASDLEASPAQRVAQHPRTHERMLQVQRVNAAHQREIGIRHWPRQVVHRSAADLQQLGLPSDRQFVVAVDHRFALSMGHLWPSSFPLTDPGVRLSRTTEPVNKFETLAGSYLL
jgi:hypothetical protein